LTVRPLQAEFIQQLKAEIIQQSSPSDLLEAASRLLSETTHMAGIVMLPRRETRTFSHIEFLPLSEGRLLVILISGQQEIHNKIIQAPKNLSPADLQAAAHFLNSRFAGRDVHLVKETLMREVSEARERLSQELLNAAHLSELALNPESAPKKPLLVSGEINLMDFSELANIEQFRSLFETLHQKEEMVRLMDRCVHSPGVQIFIGEESGHRAFDQCSLVTSTYSVNERAVGVLGVIGPTRMEYERVIPLVDITAKLVGAALNLQTLPPL
jgi:heat-inducible transcriptional repressor